MALLSGPSGLCVTSSINALSLRINWSSIDGVSYYNLYRSEIPHDTFTQVASNLVGLTYFDNPQSSILFLNARNIWYYRVSSVNAFGEGIQSNASTFLPYGQLNQINTPMPGLSWNFLIS